MPDAAAGPFAPRRTRDLASSFDISFLTTRHRVLISFAALPAGSASPAVRPATRACENVERLPIEVAATGTPNAVRARRASPVTDASPMPRGAGQAFRTIIARRVAPLTM